MKASYLLKLKDSEAGYGRKKSVWLEKVKCDGCGRKRVCMCADSSQDEYGPVVLCEACVQRAFKLNVTKPPPSSLPDPNVKPISAADLSKAIADTYTTEALAMAYAPSLFPWVKR